MSGPPNILFIMTDDHAAHAMGCYGSRMNRTPNFDRIATRRRPQWAVAKARRGTGQARPLRFAAPDDIDRAADIV